MEKIILKSIKNQYDYIDSGEYLVVADEKLKDLYPEIFPENTMFIEAGERAKTKEVLFSIVERMHDLSLTRNSTLYIVGGGTISDVASFAAGIYMRGIRHIILPTTLLSMTDAAIGGKCAINFMNAKNNVGIFKEPEIVYIDSNFTKTLEEEDLKDGYVEGFKLATLFDREVAMEMFELLKADKKDKLIKKMTEYAPLKKAQIVEMDFRDRGIRNLLNVGHTVAHFLESQFGYKISHGKAVAIGLFMESMLGYSDEETIRIFRKFYEILYGKPEIQTDIEFDFSADKKAVNKEFIDVPIVEAIGKGKIVRVKRAWLEESLKKVLMKI